MTSPTERIAAVLLAWPYPPMSEGNARKLAERVAAELRPEQNRQLAEAWLAGYHEAKHR